MLAIGQPDIVICVLLASLILFATDALRYDLIALGVAITLALTGCLEPSEAFRGFSSEAVVLIASMYVFGHALSRTGLSELLGSRILARGVPGEAFLVLRIVLLSGLLSSVLSNTGVVAALIPVCSGLARSRGIPASRLLMPLAFGSLLGGLVTLVGTSTNLLVNEEVTRAGVTPFGVFEFGPLGLTLLALGGAYFLGPGRLLLPRSPVDQSLSERYEVPKFVTEVLVSPSSLLLDRSVADLEVFQRHHVTVLGIVRARGESPVLAPGPTNRVRSDDTLILQGTPDDLLRLSRELPLEQRPHVDTSTTRLYSDDVRLVEVVIPTGSSLIGRTLATSGLRSRTNLNVVAIAKHGQVQSGRLRDTPLEVGTTLLVQGHARDLDRVRDERELLVLGSYEVPFLGREAWTTALLLIAILVIGATTQASLAVLGAAGALALVLTRCIRADQVYRAIDWSVIALVGGMLALGEAFKRWGLSESLGEWIASLGEDGLGPRGQVFLLLTTTVLLTQVLANVATAAIMAPIALHMAHEAGLSDRPFLMAVVTGSSLAFLSPVAHQSNAMVVGPGGYRYADFLRAGLPMTVIMVAASTVLIPLIWPF